MTPRTQDSILMSQDSIPMNQDRAYAPVSTSACPWARFAVTITGAKTGASVHLEILEANEVLLDDRGDIRINWKDQPPEARATLHFCRPVEDGQTVAYEAFQLGWLVAKLNSPDQPRDLPFTANLMLGGDVELTFPKQPPSAVYMFSFTSHRGVRHDPKIYNQAPTGGPD